MAYSSSVAQTATNTADLFDKLETFMLARGWTKHDDQRVASDYVVYKSLGESGNEELYTYISEVTANRLIFRVYDYWDSTGHTGTRGAVYDNALYSVTDDASSFIYWLYGDKNAITMITKVSSVYYYKYFGLINRLWSADKATTSNSETAGADVVIEVDVTTYFTVDEYYVICDKDHMERIQITAISAGVSVTATIANNYNAGARIGEDPQPNFVSHYYAVNNSGNYMTNKFDGWASGTGQLYPVYPAADSNILLYSGGMNRYNLRLLFDIFVMANTAAYNELRGTLYKNYATYHTSASSEDTITISGVTYDFFSINAKGICLPRT